MKDIARNAQRVPDETKLYPDGWPVRDDDALAEALFLAMAGGQSAHGMTFGALSEWQRDEYRGAATAAREFITAESRQPIAEDDPTIPDPPLPDNDR